MALYEATDDNISYLIAHVTASQFKCGLLNNCGGYFNIGYDNNATQNNTRKRAIRKVVDQHVVELTPLFDLSLYGLDSLALPLLNLWLALLDSSFTWSSALSGFIYIFFPVKFCTACYSQLAEPTRKVDINEIKKRNITSS